MARAALISAVAVMGLAAACNPVQADDFAPLSWLFSTDQHGPLAPAITPDRPYWNGDAAMPPTMRWHDREVEIVDEYGVTIGTRLPPPETVVPLSVEETLPAVPPVFLPRQVIRKRHTRTRVARAVCPPPIVRPIASAPLGVTAPPDPPWTPARAER